MKANELRIGNWVEFIQPKKGMYTTVEPSTFSINVEKSFKPIPLTEEWLLKFGFERLPDIDNYDTYSEYYTHRTSGLRLLFYLGNYDNASINGDIDYVDLSHVHKLQNLMFALTGEELTIKEL